MPDKTQLAEALFVAHMSRGTAPAISSEQARSVWRASVRRDVHDPQRGTLREEYEAFAEAVITWLDEPEVLASLTWGDDQDTLLLHVGGELVATLTHALKSTSDEVAAWLAETYVQHEATTAGYSPADVADALRAAARHLSAAADKVEEDWA